MSKSFKVLGLAVSALALTHLPASAQTKVTNDGISATEIVIGTHQDLSGPIKVWGVPVSNGMKMAVEEINAAGGVNGRKIKMILEDSGYDPKRAVLASQKMVERDKVFAMIGPMGSPTVLASQDILFDAGVLQLFPLTAAEFTSSSIRPSRRKGSSSAICCPMSRAPAQRSNSWSRRRISRSPASCIRTMSTEKTCLMASTSSSPR